MELFELMNDIEDCPATLLSANRHFIAKCDVKLLLEKDGIDDYEQQHIRKLENNVFTLLLFTDCILVSFVVDVSLSVNNLCFFCNSNDEVM